MKNKLEYRIENGSLIIDNYFNDLKIGSINGGSVENILKKCKLYDEEYETFLKENEYMKHIAKDFERLQQENKQLKEKLDCDLQWAFKYEKQVDNWNKLRKWIVYNKHNENTEQHYLVVDYGTLLGKMQELEGSDSNGQ
jgi:hypothetical protein|nr:MAG TPA: hypothetical protein [Caudoviricetes sp.]